MSLKTKKILIKARTLIDSPEKWIQGNFCNTEETCFCLVGALNFAYPGSNISGARMLIKDAAGLGISGSIPNWNDAPGRTHAEVMEVLDKAIAACPD